MTSYAPWTSARVQARMTEAMGVLRLLQLTLGPGHSVTSWPEMVRSSRDGDYGDEEPTVIPPKASPRDLARLEQVESWISRWLSRAACEAIGLSLDTGWIITCRAQGWTYGRIGRQRKAMWSMTHAKDAGHPRLPGGNSRPALLAIERRGLIHLATQLNNASVPVDLDTLEEELLAQ